MPATLQEPAGQAGQDDQALNFLTTDPRNAEPELAKLVESWLTPTRHFYVRSHAPNPRIDAGTFRLSVEGLVDRPLSLSLGELSAYPEHTVTATLTCAGNRRVEFNKEAPVGGVQWGAGAIGNATWTGIALSDVLNRAGLKSSAAHIWFDGLDQVPEGDGVIPFGASIPVGKAMGEGLLGALLVSKMNGQPLSADHGFPLRAIVPGYIGARSVKWLGKITAADRPSPNHYQADAYKLVRQANAIDWAEAGPIYRYPINAAIASLAAGVQLKPGPLKVAGYVLPSGLLGARVQRVFVSADSGRSWTRAELTGQDQDYCWQLWQAQLEITRDTRELIVRATDDQGGFMPARIPWNAKGYLQNAWHRLPVSTT
jgi:sulfite oxidase